MWLVYKHPSNPQVPEEQLNKFDWMTNDESLCSAQTPYIYPGFNGTYHCRQTYLSMVNLLDQFIGNVTQQLKDGGFWDNTLVVFSSDSLSALLWFCPSAAQMEPPYICPRLAATTILCAAANTRSLRAACAPQPSYLVATCLRLCAARSSLV